jgi:hypothetical protein
MAMEPLQPGHYTGTGQIFSGDDSTPIISSVGYVFDVRQSAIEVGSSEALHGRMQIEGFLAAPNRRVMINLFFDRDLVLQLKDGHRIGISLTDVTTGKFAVRPRN